MWVIHSQLRLLNLLFHRCLNQSTVTQHVYAEGRAMLLLPCVVSSSLGGRDKTVPLYATNFDSHCISFGSSGPVVWSHPITALDLPTASSLWPGQACLGWCSSSATHVHASPTHRGFGLGWCLKIKKKINLTFSANNHQSGLYTPPLWEGSISFWGYLN